MRYRVGNRVAFSRCRIFKTLEAAKAYCEAVFKRSGVVLSIVEIK